MKFQIYGLDDKLRFGQYKGRTISELVENDPRYIEWCCLNMFNFIIKHEVFRDIEELHCPFKFTYQTVFYLTQKSKDSGMKERFLENKEIDNRWLTYATGLVSWEKLKKDKVVRFDQFSKLNCIRLINILEEYDKVHKDWKVLCDVVDYDYSIDEETVIIRTLRAANSLIILGDLTLAEFVTHWMPTELERKFALIYEYLKQIKLLSSEFMMLENMEELNYSYKLFVEKILEITNYRSCYSNRDRYDESFDLYDRNWIEDLAGSNDPDDMITAYWNID